MRPTIVTPLLCGRSFQNWRPTLVQSNEFWFDASDRRYLFQNVDLLIPVNSDGQTVDGMQDKSLASPTARYIMGGTHTELVVVPNVPDTDPIYKVNIQNGLSVLRGDGVGAYMIAPFTTQVRHIIIAAKYNGATFANNACLLGNSRVINATWFLADDTTAKWQDSNNNLFDYSKNGIPLDYTAVNAPPMNEYAILSLKCSFSDVTTFLQLFRDRHSTGGTGIWDGDFCEAFGFNDFLSQEDEATAINYLRHKWAI